MAYQKRTADKLGDAINALGLKNIKVNECRQTATGSIYIKFTLFPSVSPVLKIRCSDHEPFWFDGKMVADIGGPAASMIQNACKQLCQLDAWKVLEGTPNDWGRMYEIY